MGRIALIALLVGAIAGAGAPGAAADIIAAVDVPVPAPVPGGTTSVGAHDDQFDVALLNATTGARFGLPSGVNTTSADEFHPSITPDGKWLAFERVDPSAGTTRIITVNLSTGVQTDLFGAFEQPTFEAATPFVEPSGASVLTGTTFSSETTMTQTLLSAFPTPPFPHTARSLLSKVTAGGRTLNPVDSTWGVQGAGVIEASSGTEDVVLTKTTSIGASSALVEAARSPGTLAFAHPAISDPTTDVAVFERHVRGTCTALNQCTSLSQLVYVSHPGGFETDPAALPAIVNASGADEAFPAFTPDGRYLGFVRQTSANDDRLFVYDTQTQTLLNPQGVDLGTLGAPASTRDKLRRQQGNLSLRETIVLSPTFDLSLTGTVSFGLLQTSGVGLLVERVVGSTKLFGHTVRALRVVGRVPLGLFRRGKHTLRWNLRVGGHRLPRGTYLVTPRAVKGQTVLGLGTPRLLHVR